MNVAGTGRLGHVCGFRAYGIGEHMVVKNEMSRVRLFLPRCNYYR